MNKYLYSFLLLLLALPANMFATVINGINYTLNNSARTAAVGDNSGASGDIVIPETVTSGNITYRVTSISESAFKGCTNITSVVIGNEVERIEIDAFENCSALKSVTIGSKVKSLYYAFYNCTALEAVHVSNLAAWCEATFSSDQFESTNVPIFDSNPLYYAKHLYMNGVEVKTLVIPEGVTRIGDECFPNLESLTSVIIPNSVTEIGTAAFVNCNLTSVHIGSGIKTIKSDAFYNGNRSIPDFYCYAEVPPSVGDTRLTAVDWWSYGMTLHVPASAIESYKTTGIWQNAREFVALEESQANNLLYRYDSETMTAAVVANPEKYSGDIVIPATTSKDGQEYVVTAIDKIAFYNCDSLTSVSIPSTVAHIDSAAFQACTSLTTVVLPEGITTLPWQTFALCTGLTSVTLPNSLEKISMSTFSGCSNLTSIEIPANVTSIDSAAFYQCSSLTTVTIPQGVTDIQWQTFANCTGLTSVTLPEGLKTIGGNAFIQCGNLTEVNLPNGLEVIGESAFEKCANLTHIEIPESVTQIEGGAFAYCVNLEDINLPHQLTEIEMAAFAGCLKLGSVTIPAGVTSIGDYAFASCTALTTVTIPQEMASIGIGVFGNCEQLTDVFCYAENVPAVSERTFYNANQANATLHVPAIALSAYKEAEQWKDFGTIVALEGSPDSVDVAIDSIHYRLYLLSQTAMVIQSEDREKAGGIVIPQAVVYEGNSYAVTTIGNGAFSGCSRLLYANIPQGVERVGSSIFEGCTALASVAWDAPVAIPAGTFAQVDNPNLLIYVTNATYAAGIDAVAHVVVDGHAGSIALQEGGNFYAQRPFTAESISYTHRYTMQSGYKVCQGWETLCLPFDAETITHESAGALTPFALYTEAEGQRPFWVSELTDTGWQETQTVKANKPYIISMPNNPAYEQEYCVAGNVTFAARNVTVQATEPQVATSANEAGQSKFVPTTWKVSAATDVYAINLQAEGGYAEGSVFVVNQRDVRPFEAYLTNADASIHYIPIRRDFTTGIPTLATEQEDEAVYHSLQGIRVVRPTKGIYIKDGRKHWLNEIKISY